MLYYVGNKNKRFAQKGLELEKQIVMNSGVQMSVILVNRVQKKYYH